jgi:hypothetical protein
VTTTLIQTPTTPVPYPLGRNVEHDPRSRMFSFTPRAEVPIRTKSWTRYGPVLDQGNVGACTGFAAAHAMNCKPNYVKGEGTLDNLQALGIYSVATALDEFPGTWMPTDTGSSGNGACKALLAAGLITEYRWAFGIDHLLQSLMHSPVMVGTWWYDSMFYPTETGRLNVGGSRAGGHEYLITGIASLRDRTLWLQNSWGAGWGLKGRALITFADMDRLLREDGDCVIPVGGPWT